MARRKRKFNMCPKNKFRFLTPSLCSVCESLEECDSFRDYYQKNKKKYNKFVYETIEKFPEKYQLEVVFMAAKLTFIQIVDKQTGKIEQVIESRTLKSMAIDDKIALAKGKELYIVTHRIEPVVTVDMKQKKIIEPVSYLEPEGVLTIDAEADKPAEEVKVVKEVIEEKKTPVKTVKKSVAKKEEEPETKVPEEPKKKAPRKKKSE